MIRRFLSDHKLKAVSFLAAMLCLAAYSVHFAEAHYVGLYGQSTQDVGGCGGPAGTCHAPLPSQSTIVTISAPPVEIFAGHTYTFQIVVKNSNSKFVAAGCDISVDTNDAGLGAMLDSIPGQGLTYFPSTGTGADFFYINELAHTSPKSFGGTDSAVWLFTYTAPKDTGMWFIYAAGNAVDGDSAHHDPTQTSWNTVIDTVMVVAPSSVNSGTATSSDIQIFPNPSYGQFTISSQNEHGMASVKITNEAGNTVQTQSVALGSDAHLDLTSLKNGTYFLHFKTSDGQSFLRRVVIKR